MISIEDKRCSGKTTVALKFWELNPLENIYVSNMKMRKEYYTSFLTHDFSDKIYKNNFFSISNFRWSELPLYGIKRIIIDDPKIENKALEFIWYSLFNTEVYLFWTPPNEQTFIDTKLFKLTPELENITIVNLEGFKKISFVPSINCKLKEYFQKYYIE